VIDTKRSETEAWKTVGEIIGEKDVFRIKRGRYVYQVEPEFLVDPERSARVFKWALAAGNRVIAIDEGVNIPATSALHILAVQGRASKVGLWYGTQRPSGVPLYTLSEANHTFVFRLRVDDDQKRMNAATGVKIDWQELKRKHSFFYIDEVGDVHGPMVLNLDT
jgi:DNA helicase HerA-like ATPase